MSSTQFQDRLIAHASLYNIDPKRSQKDNHDENEPTSPHHESSTATEGTKWQSFTYYASIFQNTWKSSKFVDLYVPQK